MCEDTFRQQGDSMPWILRVRFLPRLHIASYYLVHRPPFPLFLDMVED